MMHLYLFSKRHTCSTFFIEKLDGTLEDFLTKDLDILLILSAIFQITFCIKKPDVKRNLNLRIMILHINNIMYKTDKHFYIINLIIYTLKYQHMDIFLRL